MTTSGRQMLPDLVKLPASLDRVDDPHFHARVVVGERGPVDLDQYCVGLVYRRGKVGAAQPVGEGQGVGGFAKAV